VHREAKSVDYLIKRLPEHRARYMWAPRLYGLELAHIDAIAALAYVLDEFARAYGWPGAPGSG